MSRIDVILHDYADVMAPGSFSKLKPKHGMEHTIKTEGPPVFSRPWCLSPEKLELVKREFDKMEAAGIIWRSNSPWASPLLVVPKPGGQVRPCGNYRKLNNITVKDRYPLPSFCDFMYKLTGVTIF